MPRLFLIPVFIILVVPSVFSQKMEKSITSGTWYCSCNFNSDNLTLSADNNGEPSTEVRFAPSGKLILKNIKKRTLDSSFTYVFKKKSLTLKSDHKDSVKTLHYSIKKNQEKKAYELSMNFSSRYIRKKGDHAIVMNKVVLQKGNTRKVIQEGDEIAVFSQYKALHNDSINRAVWGVFAGYISDTLLLDSDQFVEHNYYKKHTDTLHYIAPLLLDTIIRIKVPVRNVTGIYSQREPISAISTNASLIGMVAGFAGIAASLIVNDGNSGSFFAQVGVFSFLTIPVSLCVNMAFSKQKFQINAAKKPKKNWIIERHMPHTILSKRTKK